MGLKHKLIGLIFVIFWLLIPASVAEDFKPCQDGPCLTGQFYSDKNDSCLKCPDQTFMNYSDHKCKDCFNCSTPDSNEVVLQACAATTDAVIVCEEGFYRVEISGRHSKGRCVPCTVCKDDERTLKKCDSSTDAICCSPPSLFRSMEDGRICDFSLLMKIAETTESIEYFAWVNNNDKGGNELFALPEFNVTPSTVTTTSETDLEKSIPECPCTLGQADPIGQPTLQPERPNKQSKNTKVLSFSNFHEEDFRDEHNEMMIVPIAILSVMLASGVFLCFYTSFQHRHTLRCFRRRSESSKVKKETTREERSEQQSLFSNLQIGSLDMELTVTPPAKDKSSETVPNEHVPNGHLPNGHVPNGLVPMC